MEDLKKTLKTLESSKAETLELLDSLLENLGESLISRLDIANPDYSNAAAELAPDHPYMIYGEKQKLQKEIADAGESIKLIEIDLRHLGELEEEIGRKEREKNDKAKEMIPIHTGLGRIVLTADGFENFSAGFEKELNEISDRIDLQQKKIDELDNAGGNIINRVTNSVKSMVSRALLSKNQTDLEKLFRNAGEKFLDGLEKPELNFLTAEEISLCETSEAALDTRAGMELRKQQTALKENIEKLKTERRETADSLDQKGNPARRISELEVFIARTQEEIRFVHRRFGSCAGRNEWKNYFPETTDAEKILEDKISSIGGSLEDTDKKINAVRIAIEVEYEKSEIAKLKEQINDKQQRINDAAALIVKMEEQIRDSEKRISELTGQ